MADPRVEAFDGVGPEITAIIIQDRERTAATAIGVMDDLEKQVKKLTAERNHYRQVAEMYHEAERCRRAASDLADRRMKEFPLF